MLAVLFLAITIHRSNIQPSEADHKITKKIKECGILLDIAVLNSIIVGNEQYYSFADEGIL